MKEVTKPIMLDQTGQNMVEAILEIVKILTGTTTTIRGEDGEDGVSIKSITQVITSNEDGGSNVIRVTLTNDKIFDFTIKNGSKGSKGEDGVDGQTPKKGTDYFTEEEKAEMVDEVLGKIIGSDITPKIGYVNLIADKWNGTGNLYSQVVSIEGVTENSQVDLTPSIDQLAVLYEKDLAFVTENDNGIVTVYAIGQKPTNDYTIQVTITEVTYG